jgi:hypothetical protein
MLMDFNNPEADRWDRPAYSLAAGPRRDKSQMG